MKLHSDNNPGLNTVTAYGPNYLEINQQRYQGTVAFGPEGEVQQWQITQVAELTLAHLQTLAAINTRPDPLALLNNTPPRPDPAQAEVLLVGTGKRQHFLPSAVLQPLLAAGVGVEAMDTQAAARTYNILMAEGRKVVVVLLPAT